MQKEKWWWPIKQACMPGGSDFVQTANQFESDIKIICNGNEINAKSMIGVLSLGAGQGSRVTIQAEGEDAEAAAAELARVIEEELPKEDTKG